jgi:hypothetical protein
LGRGGRKRSGRPKGLARSAICGLLVSLAIVTGCFSSLYAPSPEGNEMPEMKIEAVLKKHTEALMSLPCHPTGGKTIQRFLFTR